MPSHNREAWVRKFAGNRARDEMVENRLRGLGLRVLTVWECETKDAERLRRVLETYLE